MGRRPRTLALLPMDVLPGDRFIDAEGEWEVVTHPTVFREGKLCEATARHWGPPPGEKTVTWPAHERLAIIRAGAAAG